MKSDRAFRLCFVLLTVLHTAGCQLDSRDQVLATTNSQLAQRAISTRAFDTPDVSTVFRATISALQDLGFVVDRADDRLGTISATRLSNGIVRITVTMRPLSGGRTAVRASGQHNLQALTDPAPFQAFFNTLSQALFLAANEID
ncbi:hypothetical protein [Roseomonas sp. BN140053]|uniref:hypothetical protein n=1 Tax=Roseomonas sp. BN140053 TaxID=3391898 RepID=UPI0039EBADC0